MRTPSTLAPKRRRGRPRKFVTTPTTTLSAEAVANAAIADAAPNATLDQLEQAITARLRATIDAEAAKQQPVELLLITVEQAAQALSISSRTVWNLIADGRLESVKIAGVRRVALDEVKRLASVGTN